MAQPVHFALIELNTMELKFYGVEIAGTFLDAGVSSFVVDSIKDANGDAIGGQSWPASFTYEAGSDGVFSVLFDKAIALTAEEVYTISVTLADGPGRDGHWEIQATAKVRDGLVIP